MGNELRPALGTFVTREQYLNIVFCRAPGAANWIMINQGKQVKSDPKADQKEYRRLGDKRVTKVGGTVITDVTIGMYVDNDIVQIAEALGQPKVTTWAGTEEIRLDPTKVRDFMIIHYDGDTVNTSKAKFVEYLNAFRPFGVSKPWESGGDAEEIELTGSVYDWYMMPVAGA